MKHKRFIYSVLFLLTVFVLGYFVFTGCQVEEVPIYEAGS